MKPFLILTLSACSLASLGQIQKGSAFVTGSISYSCGNEADQSATSPSPYNSYTTKSNQFSTSLSGAYFVSQTLAVGVNFSYRNYYYDYQYPAASQFQSEKDRALTPGLYLRRNFPIGQKFNFFIDGSAGYGFRKTDEVLQLSNQPTSSGTTKEMILSFLVTAGVNYFITDHFAFEFVPGYIRWTKSVNKSNEDLTNQSFQGGIQLNGLTFRVLYMF